MFSSEQFTPKILHGLQSLGYDPIVVCSFLQKHSGFIVGRFCADALSGTEKSLDKYSKQIDIASKLDGQVVDFDLFPYKEHLHIVVVDCKDIIQLEHDYEQMTQQTTHPTHLIRTTVPIHVFVSSAKYSFLTCYFDGLSMKGKYTYATSKKRGYVSKRCEAEVLTQFYVDKGYTIQTVDFLQ